MILRKLYKYGDKAGASITNKISLITPNKGTGISNKLFWISQRSILMNLRSNLYRSSVLRGLTSGESLLNNPASVCTLHNHLPIRNLNKKQKIKLRVRELRKRKLSQASFNKAEELRKLSNYTSDAASEKKDEKIYSPLEALEEINKQPECPHDESIDLCIKLGIDPIKSDQQVRAVVPLPGGTGREVKVAIFTTDAFMDIAKEAGADLIVDLNHIRELNSKNLTFDILLTTKESINLLKPFGKTIGPLGLMPNIKSGTLVDSSELQSTVKVLKAGRIEVRNDDSGILHACIGKRRFPQDALYDNLKSLVNTLNEKKPEKAKGIYYRW